MIAPPRQAWGVTIDGEDLSNTVTKLSYSANSDGGTTDLAISARTDLAAYQNARVDLYLKGTHYFTGYLEQPSDDQWGEDSKAFAWGAFKSLSSQRFLIRDGVPGADYRGETLSSALLDITNRSQPKMAQAEILAGFDFTLEGNEAVFGLEAKLGEAAASLMESASVVGMDLPGWKRRYIPKPTADGGSPEATYDESDYPYGAFKVTRADRNVYASVLIYRRLESGEMAFPPILVPVQNEGPVQPPPNRVYEVAGFVGSYEQALEEATRLARTLKKGTYEFELTGIPADPERYLYTRVDVVTTEFRGPNRFEEFEVTYRCLVNDTLKLVVDQKTHEEGEMAFAGSAIKIRELRIPPAPRRQRPKSYVLGGPGPPPLYGYREDGRPYLAEELDWVSYSADTQEVLIDSEIAARYGINAYYSTDGSCQLVVEIPEDYDPYA